MYTHIQRTTCTGYTHTYTNLFYFYFFKCPKRKLPANALKLNIYISINYLWHTLWHLAGPCTELEWGWGGGAEYALETVYGFCFLVVFLPSSVFFFFGNYLNCQEESRSHLSWPRIFLARLEIKLTATATSGWGKGGGGAMRCG